MCKKISRLWIIFLTFAARSLERCLSGRISADPFRGKNKAFRTKQ
ncbi:hypothetical protein A343_2059 [Porphyromonas gingivalis JCVI SC001]|nr:hypothetical protein A343_2059 [Porphyromonas gingivalis JCVI SC001]